METKICSGCHTPHRGKIPPRCLICGEAFGEMKEPTAVDGWPLAAKQIAKFKQEGDVGIGDTLERLIAKGGGRLFKSALATLGIDCGCTGRQRDLNELFKYTD